MRNNQRIEEEFNDSLRFDELEGYEPADNDLEPFEEVCPVCGCVKELGEACCGCGCANEWDIP